MTRQRKCRFVPLSKKPLLFVLAQVRFSPVRTMSNYIDAIQDDFRRSGFPLERNGKFHKVTLTAGLQPTKEEHDFWEFQRKDEKWGVTVLYDSVVLQTTEYDRFENFVDILEKAVRIVTEKSEHTKYGLIQRIGLRYIDLIQPRTNEDYRAYLRPGFHGITNEVFLEGSHRLNAESVGKKTVGKNEGTMIVRITQNDQGSDLPPDLAIGTPKHVPRARPGELVTLVDMDEFVEGNFDLDIEWMVDSFYQMHDHLIETFHNHVVTEHAIEVWR